MLRYAIEKFKGTPYYPYCPEWVIFHDDPNYKLYCDDLKFNRNLMAKYISNLNVFHEHHLNCMYPKFYKEDAKCLNNGYSIDIHPHNFSHFETCIKFIDNFDGKMIQYIIECVKHYDKKYKNNNYKKLILVLLYDTRAGNCSINEKHFINSNILAGEIIKHGGNINLKCWLYDDLFSKRIFTSFLRLVARRFRYFCFDQTYNDLIFLINNGAKVNDVPRGQNNVLQELFFVIRKNNFIDKKCSKKLIALIKILLVYGIDANHQGYDYSTLDMVAVVDSEHKYEIINLLVAYGAKFSYKSLSILRRAQHANEESKQKVIKFLIGYGADFDRVSMESFRKDCGITCKAPYKNQIWKNKFVATLNYGY